MPASGLQLRRFIRTGELVEKVAKLHFPALWDESTISSRRLVT